jgi:hypothetical protein
MTDTTQHNADQAAKAQQEAEKKRAEEAKKKIGEERKAREEASKSGAKSGVEASKPTPTQEENDLAAMGIHVVDKEPDGSDEQPSPAEQMEKKTKQSEARPSGAGYQTRAAAPKT